MAPAVDLGLDQAGLLDLFVGGNRVKATELAARHPGNPIVNEMLENIVADATAKNLKGYAFITHILERTGDWGKYGLEAFGIGAAPVFTEGLFRLLGAIGWDQGALARTRPFVTNIAEGYARGSIKASDPDKAQKYAAIARTTEIQLLHAFRDAYGYVHLKGLQDDGTPVALDAHGYPVACVTWQTAVGGWVSSHPGTTRQQGGGGVRGQQPQQVPVAGARMTLAEGEAVSLIASGGTQCPACFKLGSGAGLAASKPLTFWQQFDKHDSTKDVYAALLWHIANHPRPHIAVDHMEDIPKLDFDAFRIHCERFHARVTRVTDPMDPTRVLWVEMNEATAREFVKGLDAIGTELKFSNKAEEAAHGALESAKQTLKDWGMEKAAGYLAKAAVALGILTPFFYALWAVVTVYFFGIGWFAPEGWLFSSADKNVQIGQIFLACVSLVFWMVPWYSGLIHKISFGLIPELSDTARNVTALLCGIGTVNVLLKVTDAVVNGENWNRGSLIAAGMLATIAADRITSKWRAEESIIHQWVKITLGNVRVLAVVMFVGFVATIALIGDAWLDTGTTFPVKVAERIVNGTAVQYIPTPKGGAFVPGDILGRATVVTAGQVCRPKGANVDLPGYAEKEVADAACTGGDVGYAVRERVFGRILDDGPVEYASLEELVLATAKADAALKIAVEANKPKPAVGAETSAPTLTATQPPPVAPVRTRSSGGGRSALADENTPCYLLDGGCR